MLAAFCGQLGCGCLPSSAAGMPPRRHGLLTLLLLLHSGVGGGWCGCPREAAWPMQPGNARTAMAAAIAWRCCWLALLWLLRLASSSRLPQLAASRCWQAVRRRGKQSNAKEEQQ